MNRKILDKKDEFVRTYQQRINDITVEKEDQIRNLTNERDVALNGSNNITRQQNQPTERSRDKYEVPLPRQIIFDGKSSWESFIHPYEAMVDVCNWENNERFFRLKNSLRGDAAEYAFKQFGTDKLSSYAKIKSSMATRFQEKRSASSFLAVLENRKYNREKKSLREYVAEIKRLVIKDYPTANNETMETIILRHFLKGLHDSQAALFIWMQDPKTTDQARELLDNYSSIKDDVRGAKIRNIDVNNESNVTEARLQEFGRDLKSHKGKKIDRLITKVVKQLQIVK